MDNDITRVVGMDVSDRHSHICILSMEGDVEEESRIATTPDVLGRRFSEMGCVRVALEVGTHSPWIGRLLEELGHEVILANPRKLRSIYESDDKSDRVDAQMIARIARLDPGLFYPVQIRSEERHEVLSVIRSRRVLVETRTKLVNHVRGVCKSFGVRLPKCDAGCFHRSVSGLIPDNLRPSLDPVMSQLGGLEVSIKECDRLIAAKSLEVEGVKTIASIKGVGDLTALTFVMTLGDSGRFVKSREVGSYLGLRPRRDQSGEVDRQLRVTRAGDVYLRSLLIGCANYILGPLAPDSALRRWGLSIADRGGKNAKKRALVAVARKLSVIMHHLWVTGQIYRPFPERKPEQEAA